MLLQQLGLNISYSERVRFMSLGSMLILVIKHGQNVMEAQCRPAWNEGKPWIEATCKDGVDVWQPIKDAAKQGQEPVNGRQSGRKLTT